ncbi:MAG TPA: hypothetical protein EYG85_10645 [Crocinitomix sp.]|nr:hypothetical protein [Crocinitomix sp.]
MTPSLLALLSIFFGIISANVFALIKPKYSFNLIGNTIVGVFGSIFFVKTFGRLGFSISSIVNSDKGGLLFGINITISIIGAIIFLILLKKITKSTSQIKL